MIFVKGILIVAAATLSGVFVASSFEKIGTRMIVSGSVAFVTAWLLSDLLLP